jgi:hypothetical protein
VSRTRHRSGIATRMGLWSASHWKAATIGWLAFVVVAFALGGLVGAKTIDPNASGPGEAGRMQRILDAGFKQPVGENILIQSRGTRVGDAALATATRDVVARISKLANVQNVHRGPVSTAKRSALIQFDIRGRCHSPSPELVLELARELDDQTQFSRDVKDA